MKNIFLILMMVFSLGISSFAYAEESERPVNPGEEPNLPMHNQGADVAAQGTGCKECQARLKGGRMQDATAAKPRGAGPENTQAPGGAKGNGGVE